MSPENPNHELRICYVNEVERSIIALVGNGCTLKEIAANLNYSEGYIKNLLGGGNNGYQGIYKRVGVKSRMQLMAAINKGEVEFVMRKCDNNGQEIMLSRREYCICMWVKTGLRVREAATLMGITPHHAEVALSNALDKIGTNGQRPNRVKLASMLIEGTLTIVPSEASDIYEADIYAGRPFNS